MTSITVAIAITELASVGELCKAQVNAGLDPDEVHRDMRDAWQSNIGSLTAASQDQKTSLIAAIRSYTGWPSDCAMSLVKTVMKIPPMFGGAGAAPQEQDASSMTARLRLHGKGPKTQTDLNFQNKLTEVEWAAARKATTPDTVWGILSLRAWLLGMCSPSEPTLYHMTSIVAHCMCDLDANQAKTSNTMARIKDSIKTRGPRDGVPYVQNFAKSAHALPAALIKAAYGTKPDDMPSDMDIPELHTILSGTKMRKNPYEGDAWMAKLPQKVRQGLPPPIPARVHHVAARQRWRAECKYAFSQCVWRHR